MIKKCASCGSFNLVNDFGTYECKDCGLDNDMYHFKQQEEIERLREALKEIVKNTDYETPRHSDICDDRDMACDCLYKIEEIANKALEGGE